MSTGEITWEPVPWLQTENKPAATANVAAKGILDKDDFFKLLLAELKYQDPLEPMKDREFIAQMASFSTLEQMQNLNQGFQGLSDSITKDLIPSLTLQQAGSMVGRDVAYYEPNNEEVIVGTVDSVVFRGGNPFYIINNQEISMDRITEIGNQAVNRSTEGILTKILDNLVMLNDRLIPQEGESDD
ncbi:MAG: flagellar hook capping FlgD N-terminal domain-containing protein [Syntrophomonadaceae bacterium]|nr:flagellar hook capping FlgD N-terminal domain-containing protein [Syntrophomonadaceae bacterium]MDD3890040.1 flagellar hook capping FlgD N-terminal domain-containing protein [Syntrophomonadaceae bacterium]MDD4548229.1 flagellar hook capping FlgD N-terminal domain-containing protein [Syntrophomonadaceae bacterium]